MGQGFNEGIYTVFEDSPWVPDGTGNSFNSCSGTELYSVGSLQETVKGNRDGWQDDKQFNRKSPEQMMLFPQFPIPNSQFPIQIIGKALKMNRPSNSNIEDSKSMAGLDIISKILSPDNLILFPFQCLREKYQGQECDICLQACPYNAIRFTSKIEVDDSKCKACGLCTHICPAGVFELKDYFQIVEQTRAAIKEGELELYCYKTKGKKEGQMPCLGLLNEGLLLDLITHGAQMIYLNEVKCPECLSNAIRDNLEQKITSTTKLVDLLSHHRKVKIQRSNDQTTTTKSGYSRREFFSHFREVAFKKITFSLIEPKKEVTQQIPNYRRLLATAVRKLGQNARIDKEDDVIKKISVNGLPFAQIEVNSTCSLCELCSKFCPTGALLKEDNEKEGYLLFNVLNCTKCGLCKQICPQEAITFASSIEIFGLLYGYHKLIKHNYIRCPKCERLYLEIEDGCSFCKREAGANAFFDEPLADFGF